MQSDATSQSIYHPQACQTKLSLLCLFFFQCLGGGLDFCLKELDACQVCKKTIQTSKYYMVVAPNLNHFPKADLAHLCYFVVWPCFIAGSAFLLHFSTHYNAFTIFHISLFHIWLFKISWYRLCHLQQKYFTEDPFRSSTELLCTILSLLCHCLPEV